MNTFDKWADRIYSETDFGRGIATSLAGVVGLAAYLLAGDWVVAVFGSVIVFPIVRIVAASYHQRIKAAFDTAQSEKSALALYRQLSIDEQSVVLAFVNAGGCVMTWGQVNKAELPSAAVESLVQRELLGTSMTADGMRETFVLDSDLFDAGQRADAF